MIEAAHCRFVLATARAPGAIAVIQLEGRVLEPLRAITGIADWPLGRARLASLAELDEGIVVRLTETIAQIMPHGGVRIVQRLVERLTAAGAAPAAESEIDPGRLYPEAADRFEALALMAIARAASPLAIDPLLDQPRRWRDSAAATHVSDSDRERSRRLNRLIQPPTVVVVGPANVGKSTLSNALLGRAMSIAFDEPGTTRDYVAGRIDLGGLVVDWHDTPGLRPAAGPIEERAVQIARRLIEHADMLIAMNDHEHPWPNLPREPDLRVMNKCDVESRASGHGLPASLRISARTGDGLPALVEAVRDRLVPPDDLAHPGRWVFDERLLDA